MNKHHDLLAIFHLLQDFIIADLIHIVQLLNSVECFYSDEGLRKWHWSETAIKEEKPMIWTHSEKPRYVKIIGKCGRESNNTDHALRGFHLSESSCN